MKATKFILIITLLSFGAMAFSHEAVKPRVTKIPLEKAMQNKTICKAMYEQLNMNDVLQSDRAGFYTALVRVNNRLYLVYGKYYEWLNFFHMGKIVTPKTKL
jgi:hypothetical protein